MVDEVLAHGTSESDGRATHQTESEPPWDRALVPSSAGETHQPQPDCPVELALTAISGRWTTLLLRDLMHRPRSYTQIKAGLPSLSDKVLSERLDQLQGRGLVHRRVQPGFPTRSTYSLTPTGQLLRPLLVELYRTGEDLQRFA